MMSYHYTPPEHSEYGCDYLRHIADLDISLKEKYELLYIVSSILSYFVDQAFNVQTDQITLQSRGKNNFNALNCHDTIENRPQNQSADAQSDGVESDSNQLGVPAS